MYGHARLEPGQNSRTLFVRDRVVLNCFIKTADIMSEIKQHVTNKTNLSGENKINENQILESGKVSRKRKAKSEPLPGKRKRTEERVSLI